MEENNIVVQNLCKSFDNFSLRDVSFQVPKGRIVGFIGENGAGKSTTINLILNELKKDGGQIQLFGRDHTIFLSGRISELSLTAAIFMIFLLPTTSKKSCREFINHGTKRYMSSI